jgi:biotin operon repressor
LWWCKYRDWRDADPEEHDYGQTATRKPAKAANKLRTSEDTQPPRKTEHQSRGRKPRTRSGPAAAETNSPAAAELSEAGAENSPLLITNNEPLGKAALQPKSRSKGADTAPVSVSSPDLPRATTKQAMLIGMLDRAQGASAAEIGQRLGWLPHTVRAAITGLRHAGREVTRSKDDGVPTGEISKQTGERREWNVIAKGTADSFEAAKAAALFEAEGHRGVGLGQHFLDARWHLIVLGGDIEDES